MNVEVGELGCSVTVEQLAVTGESVKNTTHRSAILTLGRNEFCDVILKLDVGKKDNKYVLKNIAVHKKFVREGKATIRLTDRHIQFMLFNCPPDKLIMFLKTMTTKLECQRLKGFVSDRKKLLSDVSHTFQDISPLQMKELETLHSIRIKQAKHTTKDTMITPNIKRKKRSHAESMKENMPPKVHIFHILMNGATSVSCLYYNTHSI